MVPAAMWKRLTQFLRRNLLLLLFACLIASQILTWRAVVQIGENVDHYICGTRTIPCKVVVLPDH